MTKQYNINDHILDDFFEDIEARFVKVNRRVCPTGMPELDRKDILNGGLGRGEIGVVTANTGVGKSHWQGGMVNGAFDVNHGKITNSLAMMFMKLCERYGTRANWRGYTYNDEMQSQALMQLSQIGLQFDESKSENPFAYYTAAITNSFTRILNIEKKNQAIRDDLLEMNNMNPSFTRQNENERNTVAYKKKMQSVHGDVKTVNKTGIAKLNRKLKKQGEITSDDFDDVGYKKIELKPGRKPPVIQKKW